MNKISANELLNRKVTICVGGQMCNNAIPYRQNDITLYDCLINVPTNKNVKQLIDRVRAMPYHSNEQKQLKNMVPTYIPTGTFPFGDLHDNSIISYTNLIVIDIDKQDNPEMNINTIKEKVSRLPYVLSVSLSVSGEGLFVIIPIADGSKTKEYYKSISDVFNKCLNIKVDNQCSNIARKRFVSYDDDIYINNEYVMIWDILPTIDLIIKDDKFDRKVIPFKTYINNEQNKTLFDEAFLLKTVKYILDDGFNLNDLNDNNYNYWFGEGCRFAYFNDGLDLFIQFSRQSKGYKCDADVINKWKECVKLRTTDIELVKAHFFGIAKNKYGNEWWKKII